MTIEELTRDLVSIPSHVDETQVGDRIETWLQTETNAVVTRDEIGNIIARRGDGPSLAFIGHHDTVPPADQQIDDGEILVRKKGKQLFGRGTADMKGALAAMMYAFRDANPAGELVFASFVGEESGGDGARHAVESGFTPKFAVVGEGSTGYSQPGITDVVIAHKGRRGSTLIARGESTHASVPETGENAVYRACDAIEIIRELDSQEVDILGHQMSGSVVVTGIDGGSAWNLVPDSCTVTIDERTVPGQYADLAQVELLDGIEWRVDQDLPPMRCTNESFAHAVLNAAKTIQTGAPEFVTKPHATDAGWLSEETACVICGPAEIGEAHTQNESVGLDILEQCYQIYVETAVELRELI